MKKQTDVAIEAHMDGQRNDRLGRNQQSVGPAMSSDPRRTSGRQALIPVRAYKGDLPLPTDELTLTDVALLNFEHPSRGLV